MTAQQTTFARELAAGASPADALRAAYPDSANWKPATVAAKADALADNPAIAVAVEKLRSATGATGATAETVMDAREAARLLTATARRIHAEEGRPADLARILALLADLEGWRRPAPSSDAESIDGYSLTAEDCAAQVRRQMGLDE